MKYKAEYICVCNCGKCRQMNQDNFICDHIYRDNSVMNLEVPVTGTVEAEKETLLAIFDGMGGECCGEMASLIAAQQAEKMTKTGNLTQDLLELCFKANAQICAYADQNGISSMGTTAAMILFGKKALGIGNIGDSKIFCFADNCLRQISVDHVVMGFPGRKPPLSQNLGIPQEEMLIEPYVVTYPYRDGDIFLLASDGLTDMVEEKRIAEVLRLYPIKESAQLLLQEALDNGGRDNITIIICRIEGIPWWRNIFNFQ